jgi:hypothetical protein
VRADPTPYDVRLVRANLQAVLPSRAAVRGERHLPHLARPVRREARQPLGSRRLGSGCHPSSPWCRVPAGHSSLSGNRHLGRQPLVPSVTTRRSYLGIREARVYEVWGRLHNARHFPTLHARFTVHRGESACIVRRSTLGGSHAASQVPLPSNCGVERRRLRRDGGPDRDVAEVSCRPARFVHPRSRSVVPVAWPPGRR